MDSGFFSFHPSLVEIDTTYWFYIKSVLSDFKNLMLLDCHYFDDLFTCADLTLVAVPVNGDVPDKAQLLFRNKYQLLRKLHVYLCVTIRNIQYWPFVAGFQEKNGLYLEAGLHLVKWKSFINTFILKDFKSWILPAVESRKSSLICTSTWHNVQV